MSWGRKWIIWITKGKRLKVKLDTRVSFAIDNFEVLGKIIIKVILHFSLFLDYWWLWMRNKICLKFYIYYMTAHNKHPHIYSERQQLALVRLDSPWKVARQTEIDWTFKHFLTCFLTSCATIPYKTTCHQRKCRTVRSTAAFKNFRMLSHITTWICYTGYPEFGYFMNKTGRPMVYSCSWPFYQIHSHMQVRRADWVTRHWCVSVHKLDWRRWLEHCCWKSFLSTASIFCHFYIQDHYSGTYRSR